MTAAADFGGGAGRRGESEPRASRRHEDIPTDLTLEETEMINAQMILKVILIILICLLAAFILAVVITKLVESGRRKSGKKRREGSLWEDRKRNAIGLPWSFTRYALDRERFYMDTGFFNTRFDEVRLYRITDVVLTRSLGQRIFGTGTLHVTSSDKALGNFDILNIRDSMKVKELFSEKVEEQRKENRVYTRENIGFPEHGDMDHDGFDDDHEGDIHGGDI